MNALAASQVFSRATWSGHRQQGELGRVLQREGRASRIGASDDSTRFANVVLPHLDDAYTLAVWLTDNPVDAEDVVQDACLSHDTFPRGRSMVTRAFSRPKSAWPGRKLGR